MDTPKFRKGNVVKLAGGSIVIICNHRTMFPNTPKAYEVTDWISFDSSNCSGCTHDKTHLRNETCWTCDINNGGDEDPDCETCKGTGSYDAVIKGMDKATLLADNVKAFILKRLTKNFEF